MGGASIYVLIGCSIVEQAPLLSGWEIKYAEDGRKYFVDHNTRNTTFDGKLL